MPQNLIDTPPDWQDEIVVPAPGEPAAVANDPGKPYSLFHALAALARRTRWLRGLLEAHNHDDRYAQLAHNHDNRYAPLDHHHDNRYYAAPTVWAVTGGPQVNIQVTVPASGPYLIEGRMQWQNHGDAYWAREFWIDGVRVFSDQRYVTGADAGCWADSIIYNLTAGTHSVEYRVIMTVISGTPGGYNFGMIKVTRL